MDHATYTQPDAEHMRKTRMRTETDEKGVAEARKMRDGKEFN